MGLDLDNSIYCLQRIRLSGQDGVGAEQAFAAALPLCLAFGGIHPAADNGAVVDVR